MNGGGCVDELAGYGCRPLAQVNSLQSISQLLSVHALCSFIIDLLKRRQATAQTIPLNHSKHTINPFIQQLIY